ncbi:hypothetical protein M9Y10_017913 [Tritrichomonas musculus]|uniref:Small GTP-binding protein n=1 Tax=Tritrichomonas musculus TaxID=1915356 RepID=A0ABR2HVM0_9EUKA
MDLQNRDSLHRVVTIGETSVGKTSIITQLVKKSFNPNEKSTVGAMFVVYNQKLDTSTLKDELNNVNNNGGEVVVEMQIWDTAGQERFRSLGPIYYRGAEAAVVVFDFTSLNSFERLQSWITAFQDVAGTDTIIFIIGNKIDLKEKAQVPVETAQGWAAERGFKFFSTSALTGEGVEEVFKQLANEIYVFSHKKLLPQQPDLDLNGGKDGQEKQKGCC